MSRKKITSKILRKGDLRVIFNSFDTLNQDRTLFFTKEKQLRNHFNIPNHHRCVDGGVGYIDLTWWLAEDDGVSAYNAFKQMESTLDFLHDLGIKVRRTLLFVKKIKFPSRYGRNGMLLLDKNKKNKPITAKHNSCRIYIVDYDTPLQWVVKELLKLEGKKTDKQPMTNRTKEVASEDGRLY